MIKEYSAAAILFAGSLHDEAFKKSFGGKCAFELALKSAAAFPFAAKLVMLARNDFDESLIPAGIENITLLRENEWTTKNFLNALARAGEGFDLSYFAWADSPFLDPKLAESLACRHIRGAAEYSYSDGWPAGLSPEILSPGTAGILAAINAGGETPVQRDTIFAVLQKDINAFDIETEISPVDLRQRRLNLSASSKRDLLLLRRLWDAGLSSTDSMADAVTRIILEKPALLRTLPAFYPVQVVSACPQSCALCPYPKSAAFLSTENGLSYMSLKDFSLLLDKITDFSDDAVVDLSLWGEFAMHPQKNELVMAVLRHPSLALVIETSGIGWKKADFETLASATEAAAPRKNGMPPLSWIVSLDTNDEAEYQKLRGNGFGEAVENARSIVSLFSKSSYVQAVRTLGNEDSIEKFYRFWKAENVNVIIQKYDSFCGVLPPLSAADLSPVKRCPCWHIMRDMPILLDGSVPACREAVCCTNSNTMPVLGNALSENLELVWQRGGPLFERHCAENYDGLCIKCDEYYTFNF
ncbi:MAG: spiro-SPASM protein [Spirochaetaceae bacterium]|nr:spiro-SPASM protein [Spirochaetaceae bacterium]